ncbi:hypothetical protein HW130_03125 [Streptomyces sp. PKU-EA00015]|uniref:hypothetical protein n=1 Tax=Streptomyces sp. PKU-EA00015 TaxID=2748326 RepID=UPI0015A30204|nr:hypothetical protein [Streptomyces sp. PKU-EA00015]NWF25264.1 hypothetical protein [Streptomyces sp. PKU-EA00015]
MAGLDGYEQRVVARARQALAESEAMAVGGMSDRDLCRQIGRLEVTVADLLRIIDSLTEATS